MANFGLIDSKVFFSQNARETTGDGS